MTKQQIQIIAPQKLVSYLLFLINTFKNQLMKFYQAMTSPPPKRLKLGKNSKFIWDDCVNDSSDLGHKFPQSKNFYNRQVSVVKATQ